MYAILALYRDLLVTSRHHPYHHACAFSDSPPPLLTPSNPRLLPLSWSSAMEFDAVDGWSCAVRVGLVGGK
jgi:hypothetical protein